MGSIYVMNEKDGKKYELAYNRSALVRMEQRGFKIENIEKEPLSTIVLLMRGAFYMHNPSLSDDEIDAICEDIDGGKDFIKALMELYSQALMSLSGEDKKTTKNFKWEKN